MADEAPEAQPKKKATAKAKGAPKGKAKAGAKSKAKAKAKAKAGAKSKAKAKAKSKSGAKPKSTQDQKNEKKNVENQQALRTLMTDADWSMEGEEEEQADFQPDEEVQPEPDTVTRKRKQPVAEFDEVEVPVEKTVKKPAAAAEPQAKGEQIAEKGTENTEKNTGKQGDKPVEQEKDKAEDDQKTGVQNTSSGKGEDETKKDEKKDDDEAIAKDSQFQESQNTQWYLDCTWGYVCISGLPSIYIYIL